MLCFGWPCKISLMSPTRNWEMEQWDVVFTGNDIPKIITQCFFLSHENIFNSNRRKPNHECYNISWGRSNFLWYRHALEVHLDQVCVCVLCMHIYIYTQIYTCVYTYVYKYAYIHIYIIYYVSLCYCFIDIKYCNIIY